jgi:hypothetical protein
MADRIQSFATFYPWYLNEHQKPLCRWLHFVGTGGFLSSVVYCLVDRPLYFGGALVLGLALATACFGMEARRSAAPVLLGMIALAVLAHPGILGGIVSAYFFAWIGHFVVEKNRPATFTYPLWSLAGDFRMWGEMARGRRRTGETVAA